MNDLKDDKYETEHVEMVQSGKATVGFHSHGHHHHDPALDILGENGRVEMTDEQSKEVCRRIDRVILPILCWVYFLQILDKSTIGYSSIFGLQTDTHLVGSQYSLVGSCGFWAQLGWQPFSALLIVKVPTRILMPVIVVAWGISISCMAAAHEFKGLMAARFFLGLFEGSCLPLFTIITKNWYRRSEQPLRIALWYSGNGLSSMIGSSVAFGLGHIKSSVLHSYQIMFLTMGLLTILSGPYIYWKLDNNPAEARFLTPQQRLWAVERLRDNNQGTEMREIKWYQIWEGLISLKMWLLFTVVLCLSIGASVVTVFGPLILSGLGYNKYITILFNIPFGFLQWTLILFFSWVATRYKQKGIFVIGLSVPCVVGTTLLYCFGRGKAYTAPLLVGYYLLAFLFAANPLTVSWITSNVAGQTKIAFAISLYNAAASCGNIIGPLLFTNDEKPYYKTGIKATLCFFCVGLGVTIIAIFYLMFLNKMKERQRVKNGKPAKLVDRSMATTFTQNNDQPALDEEGGKGVRLGDQAFMDLTDNENDEFVYVY